MSLGLKACDYLLPSLTRKMLFQSFPILLLPALNIRCILWRAKKKKKKVLPHVIHYMKNLHITAGILTLLFQWESHALLVLKMSSEQEDEHACYCTFPARCNQEKVRARCLSGTRQNSPVQPAILGESRRSAHLYRS